MNVIFYVHLLYDVYLLYSIGELGIEPKRSSTQMKRPAIRLSSGYLYISFTPYSGEGGKQCGIIKSSDSLVSLS